MNHGLTGTIGTPLVRRSGVSYRFGRYHSLPSMEWYFTISGSSCDLNSGAYFSISSSMEYTMPLSISFVTAGLVQSSMIVSGRSPDAIIVFR
ncbi:hypothetical protein D3C77_690070 [compost metagenome]